MPSTVPKGWEEIVTPEGERAVVPDHSIRRIQARVAGVVAVGLAAASAAVVQESLRRRELWPFAAQLVLGTIGLSWATLCLWRGRMEWWIRSGRLTLRRRFGGTVRDQFEAVRLEV